VFDLTLGLSSSRPIEHMFDFQVRQTGGTGTSPVTRNGPGPTVTDRGPGPLSRVWDYWPVVLSMMATAAAADRIRPRE